MRKVKNNIRKKLLYLTFIYAGTIFVICFIIIWYFNTSIVTHSASPVYAADINSEEADGLTRNNIPGGAENISFSYDDKYYTYLYNSELYVKELSTNKLVKRISERSGIKKAILMDNRNIIMYFTLTNGRLKLKTYNIESGLTSIQKSFKVPGKSTIKAVDYSSATNLIFINLEQVRGINKVDKIYYINIMKNVRQLDPGFVINDMLLANNSLALYYEDENNNIYCHSKPIIGIDRAKIIGCDAGDNVYGRSLDDKSTIYVIKDNNVIKTIEFNDSNFADFYSNKNDVYAVYSDYIISLSSNTKLTYNNGLRFIGMGGSNVYFKDRNNNIVSANRTI